MSKNYKGFLIDLDGTMYRGTEKIDEAVEFVKQLNERDLPYLFVTNNSSKTPEQVATKLVDMGVPTTPQHVFTTSQATANYIADQQKGDAVYVIGEEGIQQAITDKGLKLVEEKADFVVIGIDRTITYEKLAQGCLEVRNGATFISTNGDVAIPTERGLLPGNGSLTSVISVSTGVKPTFIGKPESIIVNQALDVLGTSKEDTLLVGDNYDTDILAGIRADIDTLIVHTGVTTKEHLKTVEIQPTHAVNTLAEWPFE
ncbi:TIGR01457 family HAD-type hydrolase [Desertibacillus haloalkaliphilus]|uniref:TIGR01457 family HAD-type hydrolase n=1 Tax=Desertibacillus haloalkaliphilus TaxID=1328930 RepID=UPI001C27C9B8|nr:TIGR01457 family HAD-type hydrolase [Desertibacillus haloalkaliphilus]MBU8906566.1 TIGR01457 family HAD-type hydrolase [Desertibacillus haloalkaliphilus]